MRAAALGVVFLLGCGATLGPSSKPGDAQEGLGSWYGKGHHGGPTASGERFNMYDHTAAHRYLRFRTQVLVQNLRNGSQVVVRINDRGPFVSGRIIDLSYAAARQLGMLKAGVVPVRVTVLNSASRPTTP